MLGSSKWEEARGRASLVGGDLITRPPCRAHAVSRQQGHFILRWAWVEVHRHEALTQAGVAPRKQL